MALFFRLVDGGGPCFPPFHLAPHRSQRPMMTRFPNITPLGLGGLLVSFSEALGEAENRAALAFAQAADLADLPGLQEVAPALTSVLLRFDPKAVALAETQALLSSRDWTVQGLPGGRKLWRIATCFDPDLAPQLADAALAAGLSTEAVIAGITGAPLRVLTLGYAPGQPYLGTLEPAFDIPRMTALNPVVPIGAVTLAIRQIVLFAAQSQTGWRHVGQTRFAGFDLLRADPILLRAGDEVHFTQVSRAQFDATDKSNAATWEAV